MLAFLAKAHRAIAKAHSSWPPIFSAPLFLIACAIYSMHNTLWQKECREIVLADLRKMPLRIEVR